MDKPTVDDLFRWRSEVKFGRKIWMRTLGAKDDSARTRASIMAGRLARGQLLVESPQRNELIEAMACQTREDHLAVLMVWHEQLSRVMVTQEPKAKLHEPDPVEPEEPTLEGLIEAEEQNEEAAVKTRVNREEWVQEQVRGLMSQYEAKSDEELFDLALSKEIEAAAQHAYSERWEWETLARSCFKDSKMTKPMFPNAAAVSEMGHHAKDFLIREYYALDRFARDAEALKN